MNQTIR